MATTVMMFGEDAKNECEVSIEWMLLRINECELKMKEERNEEKSGKIRSRK